MPQTGAESAAAPERGEGHVGALSGRKIPEDWSPGGNGGSNNRSPARNKASSRKVPRLVTGTRSGAARGADVHT